MCSLTSLASSTKRNDCPSVCFTRHDRYDGSMGRQWPPTPGPGVKCMKPNGLVGRGVDRVPDVDVERVGEHGQLVDQCDVDVAERVLEQLGQLGLPGRRHRHGACRPDGRRTPARPPASRRRGPETTFGVFSKCQVGLPGSMRSGRVAQVEVPPATQPAAGLEDRADQLLGGARVGGGLEDHAAARPHRWGREAGPRPRCRLRSGAPSRRGVGTEITARSKPSRSLGSALGR